MLRRWRARYANCPSLPPFCCLLSYSERASTVRVMWRSHTRARSACLTSLGIARESHVYFVSGPRAYAFLRVLAHCPCALVAVSWSHRRIF